jgi:hypothetical protein
MDDRTHHHAHGGRVHVHASVDHLASQSAQSARLAIRLDAALMETLGVAADGIVRVATDRGRRGRDARYGSTASCGRR